jgi:hypothetical protein
MTKRSSVVVALVAAGAVAVGTVAAIGMAQSGNRFDANRLSARFEVPVVSSNARGTFEATLNGNTVNYRLSWSDLESPVTQAHIHVAQTFASGGISVWLCGTGSGPPFAGPAGTPTCPGSTSGTIEDSFQASDVVGPTTQGVPAGAFEELLGLMRAGLTYANVHSMNVPGGEIRGQIKSRGGGGDNDDDDD